MLKLSFFPATAVVRLVERLSITRTPKDASYTILELKMSKQLAAAPAIQPGRGRIRGGITISTHG